MTARYRLLLGGMSFGCGVGVMLAPQTFGWVFGAVLIGVGLIAYSWKEVK